MTDHRRVIAGRYRLTEPIGRGGMGVVWRARDETLDREVAVKEVLVPQGIGTDEAGAAHRRVLREARAAARFSHPGVVTVHDVALADGRPWVVMELVDGRSLEEVIRRDGPLPPERAAAIGRQVLAALRAAHGAGVPHRDVKPANILVTGDDRVVLTDFGIAVVAGDTRLTRTGQLVGSPAYMAPERLRGRPDGPAADLWGLGVTLYAAVEGAPPFRRTDPAAVYGALLTEEPAPPRNAGPLAPVIAGLLVKDPERRMTAPAAADLLAAAERSAEPTRREVPAHPEPGGDHALFRAGAALSYAAAALFGAGMLLDAQKVGRDWNDATVQATAFAANALGVMAIAALVPQVLALWARHRRERPALTAVTLAAGLGGVAAALTVVESFYTGLLEQEFRDRLQGSLWLVAWVWLVPAGALLWRRSRASAVVAWLCAPGIAVPGALNWTLALTGEVDGWVVVGDMVMLVAFAAWALTAGRSLGAASR
ncbi:serine/threonine-protein kinase [Actinomadura kijaniata]|uniref:serine/threonine-protein kinase n=1 Tax=Actinomadura kijaniata TaxID=46161 RepID=UPI00082AADBC|nr:serine/threonine-protein kinase [Actinomadura kijaniata]